MVQSKQGEALQAEIDIPEISQVEQIDLEASLAGPEVYRAVRIELPTSNGSPIDIQVQLMRRSNGRPYLKITSKQTVQTDSLDLLIDIRWANGRLLRDISLSLDDGKSTKPVNAPLPVRDGQILVKRGDTAGELVGAVTPEGVTLEQMLLAMLRSNPDAFVNDNVNRLKAGALVTLPTEEQAREVSAEDARREIRVQAKDFQAYKAELAAHAPNGQITKAGRDATGKLDAKIENKNLKPNQDKLTLTKPAHHGAEEKLAKQREAQEVASRAAEISRNIAELEKIAAATTASSAEPAASTGIEAPASAAQEGSNWLDELMQDPNTPMGAGAAIAALLLIAVWRRRSTNEPGAKDIEGLPPLNVKFDLDLPAHQTPDATAHGHTEEVMLHAPENHEHPHDHEANAVHHAEPTLDNLLNAEDALQAVRPTLEMPNISLDLDEAPVNDHPFQVRMDLADELWKLGQLHTSRALMEEVANEASGAVKEKALQWLAERG